MKFSNILLGFKKHKLAALGRALTAWGTIWLMLEPIMFYVPRFRQLVELNGELVFWSSLVVGLVAGATALFMRNSVTFTLPTTSSRVTIQFGDFFATEGHKGIAVNENFDTEIGTFVAPKSIHGQFITKVLNGNSSALRKDLLNKPEFTNAARVARGPSSVPQLPIGTAIVLSYQPTKYVLFSLSRTNQTTGKASSDPHTMLIALHGLWKTVRDNVNGETFNLPMVGGGQSGVGLRPIDLLRLIVLSIVTETRAGPITSDIKIILHRDLVGEIDLEEVKNEWRH